MTLLKISAVADTPAGSPKGSRTPDTTNESDAVPPVVNICAQREAGTSVSLEAAAPSELT